MLYGIFTLVCTLLCGFLSLSLPSATSILVFLQHLRWDTPFSKLPVSKPQLSSSIFISFFWGPCYRVKYCKCSFIDKLSFFQLPIPLPYIHHFQNSFPFTTGSSALPGKCDSTIVTGLVTKKEGRKKGVYPQECTCGLARKRPLDYC